MAKHVYFGFYYEDVGSFRVNVVRNHNKVGAEDEKLVYFDDSIWEKAKTKGPNAVKNLIDTELKGTSVTCILIGSETYNREWVRYEIFESIKKGNKIIGIHINCIPDRNKITKSQGPNPFEYLSLWISKDGMKITPCYYDGGWRIFEKCEDWPVSKAFPEQDRDKVIGLDGCTSTYDWMNDNGYDNFRKWIS